MNTSVADVNFLFTNAVSTIDKMPSVSNKRSDDVSFANYMNTAEKPVKNVDSNDTVNKTKTTVEKPGRKDLDNQKTNTEDVNNQDQEDDLVSEVKEKVGEIKDAIKEKFQVSDEDIEAAMEMLNLSMVDLLNPDCLKDLMMSLTGQEDTVSLLTNEDLYTDMMEIINLASDLTEEIKTDFDMTDEELETILSEVKVMDEKHVTEEVPEEHEVKSNDIKVEVNVSDEIRTSDPKILAVNSENNTKQTQNGQDSENDLSQMSQPVMHTETVTVSDAVETVRQFSSYVSNNEVVEQVTEFIKVNISPETTSMELQLHPASLGTVNMNVISQNGTVTAQLLVQTESVKEALEAQLVQLQEVFEEQGTKVEAVEVAVASYDLDRGPFQDRDDRQDRQNADKGSHKKVNLNLNDLNDDDLSNLDENDQLARRVMEMNGTSIDFSA